MDPDQYRVDPGTSVHLADWSTNTTDGFDGNKADAQAALRRLNERLAALQQMLYAQARHKVLIVLQGMDTSGKDGTIKHVFRTINPVGCEGRQLQAAQRRGAGPRLPVAHPRAHAPQRTDGHLQPQPLRGRAGGAGARSRAGEGVAEALRAHPRLREDAGRRGHGDREVVPPHLQEGAEGTASRSGSTTRPSTGSSSTATSASEPTGTRTPRPTRRPSPRPPRPRRPGTSCRPTASGIATWWCRSCSSTSSRASTCATRIPSPASRRSASGTRSIGPVASPGRGGGRGRREEPGPLSSARARSHPWPAGRRRRRGGSPTRPCASGARASAATRPGAPRPRPARRRPPRWGPSPPGRPPR